MEFGQGRLLRFDPFRRIPLEVTNQVREFDVSSKSAQDVNVIFGPTDDQRGGFEVAANAGEICMGPIAEGMVLQERFAVLCGIDDMKIDLCQ